ncbi:hypothetical protein PEC18_36690 [Paucibacter sp. O1-1]|nr:hypothetical protein [Paucibacter sp. O1-1]MDA3831192.1 hypothetical protein [Paucibacter sp. O1-1]
MLVLIPTLTIILGAVYFKGPMMVGLPVLAILGIMILLGTLSLVAMLFRQLDLTDKGQPLALPPGSMRATIALALIVLFAIISITLYMSISDGGEPYKLPGLRETERNALVVAAASRVVETFDDQCAKPTQAPVAGSAPPSCATDDRRYIVVLRPAPSSEAVDLAKQLLVLVGTLMTSVTSYYFATRAGAEGNQPAPENGGSTDGRQGRDTGGSGNDRASPRNEAAVVEGEADTNNAEQLAGLATRDGGNSPQTQTAHAHIADTVDGCDVEIVESTPDERLPKAVGGIAAPRREV